MEHHTTIEDLARMINEGFKTTATKEDIRAVNTRFDSVESRLDHLDARMGRIEAANMANTSFTYLGSYADS